MGYVSGPEARGVLMQPEYIVWLPANVLAAVCASATSKEPVETGGILIGYWATEAQAVVTNTIGAGPRAAHGRISFSPDHDYQVRELSRLYEASGGVETYLGDWHSHPGQSWPRLSPKDRSTLKLIAKTPEARVPMALMMIVGGAGGSWSPRVWVGRMNSWLGLWDKLLLNECELKAYRKVSH